jgi:hypothetical protein
MIQEKKLLPGALFKLVEDTSRTIRRDGSEIIKDFPADSTTIQIVQARPFILDDVMDEMLRPTGQQFAVGIHMIQELETNVTTSELQEVA